MPPVRCMWEDQRLQGWTLVPDRPALPVFAGRTRPEHVRHAHHLQPGYHAWQCLLMLRKVVFSPRPALSCAFPPAGRGPHAPRGALPALRLGEAEREWADPGKRPVSFGCQGRARHEAPKGMVCQAGAVKEARSWRGSCPRHRAAAEGRQAACGGGSSEDRRHGGRLRGKIGHQCNATQRD